MLNRPSLETDADGNIVIREQEYVSADDAISAVGGEDDASVAAPADKPFICASAVATRSNEPLCMKSTTMASDGVPGRLNYYDIAFFQHGYSMGIDCPTC